MTPADLQKLIEQLQGDRTKLIDKLVNELYEHVGSAQQSLYQDIVEKFMDKLDIKDGKITNSAKNRSLLNGFDAIYNDFSNNDMAAVVARVMGGATKIMDFNTNYYTALTGKAQLAKVQPGVEQQLNQWLGIGADGEGGTNGYIGTIGYSREVKEAVKNVVFKAVVSGQGYFDAKKQLGEFLKGNNDFVKGPTGEGSISKQLQLGYLRKYYRNFIYDTYSQIDRANQVIYADKLELQFAIYEGGIISTTREFCRERNGKVFHRSEIAKFDPLIARPPNYNPFVDLGGFSCRHHLNWIPDSLAIRMRPDATQFIQAA